MKGWVERKFLMKENTDESLVGRQRQFLYEAARLVFKEYTSKNFINDEC
jgi:hypothetical protein